MEQERHTMMMTGVGIQKVMFYLRMLNLIFVAVVVVVVNRKMQTHGN